MKKILTRLLGLTMVMLLAVLVTACGGNNAEEKDYTYELAMITASAQQSIDDESYTQAAWEGLREFAEENKITYKYYEPEEDSLDGRLSSIDDAARAGAKIIACAGEAFEEVVFTAQDKYSDITFILLDGFPQKNGEKKTAGNCAAVKFNAVQAGYLAGYSAVSEGYRDVAFLGADSSKMVKNYGYGFVQGANDASSDHGGYPTVRYVLCDAGESAAKTQKRAEDLYKDGVEVIFAAGGDIFNSVAAEADIAKAKVISAGTDRNAGKTVIASAVKNYKEVMKEQLSAVSGSGFKGGKNITLGVKQKAVDLKMKKNEFVRFTKDDYKALYKKAQNKKFKQVKISRGNFPAVDLMI